MLRSDKSLCLLQVIVKSLALKKPSLKNDKNPQQDRAHAMTKETEMIILAELYQ